MDATLLKIQRELAARGRNPGPLDGDFGPQTRDAMWAELQSTMKKPAVVVDNTKPADSPFGKIPAEGWKPVSMAGAIPAAWMPRCTMKGIVAHWTAGRHDASDNDREHYHFLWEHDGKIVRGDHEVSDNVSAADNDYAAHTRGCNTGFIGVSLCCMGDTQSPSRVREEPFVPGPFPMTKVQWDAMVAGIAQLCKFYGIPVTPRTVLSHAEVEKTLGIKQRQKWDFTRLAFDLSVKGAKACGDKMRAEVKARL
jgi:hypothetical protein